VLWWTKRLNSDGQQFHIILFLPIFYTIVCGNKTFEKGTSFSLSDAQSLNDWDNIDVGAVMSVLNKHLLVYGVKCHFQQYCSYIKVVRFSCVGNRSTRRKPPTFRKSLTKLYPIMLYRVHLAMVIILFLPIFYTIVCGNKTFEKGTSFSLSDAQSLND
jgi:hypothetical protein